MVLSSGISVTPSFGVGRSYGSAGALRNEAHRPRTWVGSDATVNESVGLRNLKRQN